MAKRRINPILKAQSAPETLSRAEQFLVDSLKFLKQPNGEWLPLASVNRDNMVAECDRILQSQDRAKRQFVYKMTSFTEHPDLTRAQNEVIALLNWRDEEGFQFAEFENEIVKAVRKNDWSFFTALGTVLSKDTLKHFGKIEYLLINHWTDCTKSHPPLCFFSDAALVAMYGHGSSLDSMRKLRQRLALEQATFYQVTVRLKDKKHHYSITGNPRGR